MNRRALVEHLLRKHELLLVKTASSHERFAALKSLERAEKRFLLCFMMALVSGGYSLAMQLWGLSVNDLLTLPVYRVVWVGLGIATLATAILAILGYLSIGLVIERAVEIKPRE